MKSVAKVFAAARRFGRMAMALLVFSLLGNSTLAVDASIAATVVQLGEAFMVDVVAEAPVSIGVAWEVLTDFDNMALFLGNLKSSKITRRDGNALQVRQKGVAQYGLLSLSFESEREIRLEPKKRILAKSLSGSLKRMESEALLKPGGDGVLINYHAEIVPDSALARMFGATVVRHEVEEQFRDLAAEMMRRQAPAN